jgi:hypothetical protein
VLQCSSCLPEQGLLRPRHKISGLPNSEQSQLSPTNLHPRGTTSNCKHPVFTGAPYLTSCFPNIPPHSNKGEGVRVKTNGRGFGICGRGSQRPREDPLQLERKEPPSILPQVPPPPRNQFAPNAWRKEWRFVKGPMQRKIS